MPESITAYNGSNVVNTTYTYNKRRLLELERMTWGTINWPIDYAYDANGHLSSQSSHGVTVTYAPNALGQATQAGVYASNVSYFPNGALKQFTYGNGIVHTLTQNARGLPERSRDAYGTTAFHDDIYDHDQNGNVAGITDGATGRNQRGNRDMTYDGLDRLTQAISPMFGTATYGYDALDNLTRVAIGGTSPRDHWYCYDGSNRLTNVKTGSCGGATVIGLGYDVQGNVLNKNGETYTFDFGNRLRASDAGPGVSYVYDGLGRRVRDFVDASKYSLYSQAGQLVLVSDLRAQEVQDYIYLAGSLLAVRIRDSTTNVYRTEYYHTDALGSAVVLTDANRQVVERKEYEPYGKGVNDDRPGYTGHVMDAASGLIYMQQRYYDPGIGMFLSVDPVTAYSNPFGQFHRYRYANNNPYRFIDPDGRLCADATSGGQCVDVSNVERKTAGDTTALGDEAVDAKVSSGSSIRRFDNPLDEKTVQAVVEKDGELAMTPLKTQTVDGGAVVEPQTIEGKVKALVHPHPVRGAGAAPGKEDANSVAEGRPMYIVNGRRVFVLEASSGTWHYRVVKGRLTETEVGEAQEALDKY